MTTSVVVVAYGEEPLLETCLRAVLADLAPGDEVLVVDNGMVVAPPALDAIRVLQPVTNVGFAAGCRLGVREAHGDVIVFVNSDAVVRAGAIPALVAALDDPATGLVCGCVVLSDHPGRINSAGNPVHLSGLSWAGGYLDAVEDHRDAGDVTSVTGAFFATRREVWDLLGGMRDDFFLYYEDTDLSLRCWLAGLRVNYEPQAVAEHSYDFDHNADKMYLLERNRLSSVLTVYPGPLLRRALPVILALEPLYLVIALRDGWARQKVRAWAWLLRNVGAVRERRRSVQAQVRDVHVLDALLVPEVTQTQFDPPRALTLLNRCLTAYWRLAQPGPVHHA